METMSRLSQDNQLPMSRVRNTTSGRQGDTATSSPKSDKTRTKLYIVDSKPDRRREPAVTSLADIDALKTEKRHGPTVCVIENVSPKDFQNLESTWGLDPEFFVSHVSDRSWDWDFPWPPPRIYVDSQYLWDRSRDFTALPEVEVNHQVSFRNPKKWDYIDGVFEYHGIEINKRLLEADSKAFSSPNHVKRECFYTNWQGEGETLCSNTRISYYRVDDSLYFFFVDAPLCLQDYRDKPRHLRPTLRLPYSVNWGGILLPQLLSKENGPEGRYNIRQSLVNIFKYRWQRELLFEHEHSKSQAFPTPPLCYMMVNSLWWSNLDHLANQIRQISFRRLRNPSLDINELLHDLREDLAGFMNTGLAETDVNIPASIRTFWRDQKKFSRIAQDGSRDTPDRNLSETLRKAEKLERFLMHTFEILMSSVSIQDARKVSQLTNFATVFLPLSLVAGVFGMNVKEFNNSILSVWVSVVVAIVILVATIIVFAVFRLTSNKNWTRFLIPRGRDPI